MKKLLKFLHNWNLLKIHTCELKIIDATPNSGTSNQVRTLYVKTTNVVSLYVNEKKVKKEIIIKASPHNDKNFILIKAKGLFNSKTKTLFVPTLSVKITTSPFALTGSLKLAFLKKSPMLRNMLIRKSKLSKMESKTKALGFTKIFVLKSNNQTLKTIKNL